MSTHPSIGLVRLQTPEQGLPQPGSALPQPSAGGPRFSSRLPAVGGGLGVPILGHHSPSDSLLHSLPQFLASLLLRPEVVDVATDGQTGRPLMRRKLGAVVVTDGSSVGGRLHSHEATLNRASHGCRDDATPRLKAVYHGNS